MERSLKPDCEEAEQLSHKNGLGSSLDAAHDDITGLGSAISVINQLRFLGYG